MENKSKTQLNLVSLGDYLKGRDFRQLSEEERLEICGEILKKISPNSQNT
ncbi:MAG TPA: hypothetical protein PK619_01880 [bacterium]|nr:hypothetical protein [bacterium]HPN81034.1 hypothetical protein [bacterium]HPW39448.1 hypothetical protein [bacterium]